MKHIFATGEELYKKNRKDIEQGTFIAQYLNYDVVNENTIFEAVGTLGEKSVSVKFKINEGCFDDINFRHSVKILMQSDLIVADWDSYEITYL
jgi:hypothetical protein